MNITYGFELELSDVDRSIDIPPHLGRWEGPKENGYYMGAELDIVNTLDPFKGVGSDPLCETCTVGGEINVSPSDLKSQFMKVYDIINLFPAIGNGHVNHFHVHVYFDELSSLDVLKNLIRYTIANEEDLINVTYLHNWNECNMVSASEWGSTYLLQDGGRYLNEEIAIMLDRVETMDQLKELLNKPGYYYKDGVKTYSTSIRTAVNFSNLIKNKTLEFRCFRSSLQYHHILSQLLFVTHFIKEGVKGNGRPVAAIIQDMNYEFAPLQYVDEHQAGWEKTRYEKGRGDKYKYYFDAGMPVIEHSSDRALFAYNKAIVKMVD